MKFNLVKIVGYNGLEKKNEKGNHRKSYYGPVNNYIIKRPISKSIIKQRLGKIKATLVAANSIIKKI